MDYKGKINTKIMENIETSDQEAKIFAQWQVTPSAYQKSKAWYVFMALIVLLFVFYDLFTGGWIMSVTFLLMAGVYYFLELKPSSVLRATVSDHGVSFGGKFYSYSEIKSFWLIQDNGLRSLHLKTLKGIQREIAIDVPQDLSMAKLRDYLLLNLPEEPGKKDSFSDQLIRNLGL